VHLEASTKPPIHNLYHEFLINMAFTMACPNFKKGLKMAFGPLGVRLDSTNLKANLQAYTSKASYLKDYINNGLKKS
jgi:hypothetical protein